MRTYYSGKSVSGLPAVSVIERAEGDKLAMQVNHNGLMVEIAPQNHWDEF